MIKKILLLSLLTLLTNCASNQHNGSSCIVSTTGSSMGAVTAGGACAGVVESPEAIAVCAAVGGDAEHGLDRGHLCKNSVHQQPHHLVAFRLQEAPRH